MKANKSRKSAQAQAIAARRERHAGPPWGRLATLTMAGSLAVLWGGQADAVDAGALPVLGAIRGGVKAITTTGNRMTVEQNQRAALIDWQKFNIGSAAEVYFKQPDAGSRILNRVIGTEASVIAGKLSADGQVFLLNRNGILINQGAQVNVGSLVASTLNLNMSDEDFLNPGKQVFHDVEDYNGVAKYTKFQADGQAGDIVVAALAKLTAAQQGSIVLIARNIDNSGIITAPDGQVILAAGNKAFLWQRNTENTTDPRASSIRGLMVEISADEGPLNVTNVVNNLGTITADRGNVSIAALAINQKGRISAGTSVIQNGSIWLTARSVDEPADGSGKFGNEQDLDGSGAGGNATRYGQITFAPGSRTETPLLADGATLSRSDSYTNFKSSSTDKNGITTEVSRDFSAWIHVAGGRIENQAEQRAADGSVATAGGVVSTPGGRIDLIARGEGARVLLGAGSLVSAAGNWVDQSMESNIIHVTRLTSNDLADSPLQRSGILRGMAVDFDMRKGSTVFNAQPYIDNQQQTVQQKATAGGEVRILASQGDVVALAGSTVDVSGGGTRYASGYLSPTKLRRADGKIVDIAAASPLDTYTGAINAAGITRTYFKPGPMGWNVSKTYANNQAGIRTFESGYVDGASGGKMSVIAPRIVKEGDWLGGVTLGRYQVSNTDASKLPAGATLVVGDKNTLPAVDDYLVNKIRFGQAQSLPTGFDLDTPLAGEAAAGTVVLTPNQAMIVAGKDETYQYQGFGKLDLYANDEVSVPAGVTVSMAPGAAFAATTRKSSPDSRIEIAGASNGQAGGAIVAPAGSITLKAPNVHLGGGADALAGARIDAGGVVMADARPRDGMASAGGATAQGGADLNEYVAGNFSVLLDQMSSASGKSLLTVAAPRFAVNAASGAIKIESASVVAEAGSSLSAMGGFRLAADNSVVAGNGGDIGFVTLTPPESVVYASRAFRVEGTLLGYSLATGAKLALAADSFTIADTPGAANLVETNGQGALRVRPGFFRSGGFSKYSLTSATDLKVLAGTQVRPQARGMAVAVKSIAPSNGQAVSGLPADLAAAGRNGVDATVAGGRLVADLHLRDKPAGERAPASLALEAKLGSLTLEAGTALAVDPKGDISLAAKGDPASIEVLGKVSAPGGKITLNLSRGSTRLAEGDPGFDPLNPDAETQSGRIHLGAEAELSAAGAFVESGGDSFGLTREQDGTASYRRRVQGSVIDGGSISLLANEARIIADPGSRMDVSAAAAVVDLPADASRRVYAATPVWGNAGSIALDSTEASRLDGRLAGKSAGQGAGGSLSVNFHRRTSTSRRDDDPTTWVRPDYDHAVVISSGVPGNEPLIGRDGKPMVTTRLSADALAAGGFDAIRLKSDHSLAFTGSSTLSAARSLTLDAPVIDVRGGAEAAEVKLQSAHLTIMNSTGNAPSTDNANPTEPVRAVATHGGSGILRALAKLIDLAGSVTIDGVATGDNEAGQPKTSVVLDSSGDIRASGMLAYQGADNTSPALVGGLYSEGNVELRSRQVYPTTQSDFTIASRRVDADTGEVSRSGTVSVVRNSGDADTVLSAGGRISLSGKNIVQAGSLKAPLGTIRLDGDQVTLKAGSLTSVSLDGQTVPFGETQFGGLSWIYNVGDLSAATALTAPPEKRVELTGRAVLQEAGATIDLSGGGGIQAFEFIAGPGGSKDVLQTTASNKTWAILPSQRLAAAPIDTHLAARNGTTPFAASAGVGYDTLYISGVKGLADGYYPLLDAHYALLPGAYQVSAASGSTYANLPAGTRTYLTDGTSVLSTYRGIAGTALRESGTAGYVIQPGSVSRKASEFQLSSASFFADLAAGKDQATPRLPSDAGYLAVTPTQTLALDGTIATARGAGGQAAMVDISSERIRIVGTPSDAASDAVELSAASLGRIDASLLIGGKRNADGSLQTLAQQVVVANDASNPLTVSEVMLAAQDKVEVRAGAVIDASRSSGATGQRLTTSGSGALLFASAGAQLELERRVDATGLAGDLSVATGARVSGKSVLLDATGNTRLDGSVAVAAGGAFGISGGSVAMGETLGFPTAGLVLDNAQLASFASLADFRIRSYSTLDLVGRTVVGQRTAGGDFTLGKLVLDAGQVVGHRSSAGGDGQAAIAAKTVVLQNTTGQAGGDTVAAESSLAISAANVFLGSGEKALRGFSRVELGAAGEVVGQGSGKTFVEADLGLTAQRLVTARGADQALVAARYGADKVVSADFALDLKGAAGDAAASSQAGAGGRWSLAGKRVAIATAVVASAGKIEIAAKGSGADDGVTLASGGQLLAAGTARAFTDKTVYASGGSVAVSADNGDISLQAGSVIDVAGARNAAGTAGGDAGRVTLTAARGTLSAAGNIRGSAVAGQKAGASTLDAARLDDLAAINRALNAGGLSYERLIRQRQGDVEIAPAYDAGDAARQVAAIKAEHVNIAADSGSIRMGGLIDASAEAGGGRVELFAAQDAVVTGRIDARGTGTAATTASHGGQVEIAAGNGRLEFGLAAVIDVSAGATGNAGRVTFAVRREADGSLAPVSDGQGGNLPRLALQGTIKAGHTGSGPEVVVRGDRAYTAGDGVVNADDADIAADFAAFMGNRNTLRSTLKANQEGGLQLAGMSADEIAAALGVRAGIEIDSGPAGDLSLNSAWDLTQAKWTSLDGQTLPPGLLTLRAKGDLTIANSLGLKDDRLPGFKTWSFRLVGGADQGAANPLAVAGGGSVVIQDVNGKTGTVGKVRTGTGDIEIAAGGDLVIGNSAGHGNRAVVYTAGVLDTSGAVSAPSVSDARVQRYTVGGGDIRIAVGGNAIGSLDPAGKTAGELVTDWLRRTTLTQTGATQVLRATPASWWVYRPAFRHNVGSFGGGNITVNAGGDVVNLGVVAPSSGRANIESDISASQQALIPLTVNGSAVLEVRGGGNIDVATEGSVKGSEFLLALGKGSVKAGGDVGKDSPTALFVMGQGSSDGSNGGADLRVEARGSADIQNVSNPTILAMSQGCTGSFNNGTCGGKTGAVPIEGGGSQRTGFFTYGATASTWVTAVTGDLSLGTYASTKQTKVVASNLEADDWSGVLPPRFSAFAMAGSIAWKNELSGNDKHAVTLASVPINLYSSDSGALALLADESIKGIAIQALNVSLSAIPTWDHPGATGLNNVRFALDSNRNSVGGSAVFSTDRARTVAVGSEGGHRFIVEAGGDLSESRLKFSEAAALRAGRDIDNVALDLQNVSAGDESIVSAGRKMVFDPSSFPGYDGAQPADQARAPSIKIAGPGTLTVETGRLIDLGNSQGIVADGQTRNQALGTDTSARIVVLAGVKGSVKPATVGALLAAVKFFGVVSDASTAAVFKGVSQALGAAASGDAAALDRLVSVFGSMAENGASKDIRTAARLAGEALSYARSADTPVAFLPSLLEAMRSMAAVTSGYPDAANAAVKKLTATALAGNEVGKGAVELFRSKIMTTGGSGIDLVVPGMDANGNPAGTVNAGRPGGSGGNLGVFTQTGGAIQALVSGDLNVNQSKILTAQGGDIMLYSSDGSIDAGRGALTSRTSSPPRKVAIYQTITRADGNTESVIVGYTYLPPSDVAGSGIRTVTSDPDGPGPRQAPPSGSVYLFAPKGSIDAGEAGIFTDGDIFIRANAVINAGAISAAGSSSGVPVADTGALGSLTTGNVGAGAGKASDDAVKAANAGRGESAPQALRPMLLTVEVLSFGE